MEKLLFTLILVLTVGIIYLITGRNRRQINKIPEGMAILCQPPGKRYVVYALGVLAVVFVGIFSILYIMDGAPGEARGMWSLCVAMAILLLIVTIFDCYIFFTLFTFQYVSILISFHTILGTSSWLIYIPICLYFNPSPELPLLF